MMLWLKTFCGIRWTVMSRSYELKTVFWRIYCPKSKKWDQPLTYDNLSKSLHTFSLGFYPSLVSFKASGLLWPLRKSSAFFILYPRCSDSNPSNTCNNSHMSRADSKSHFQPWRIMSSTLAALMYWAGFCPTANSAKCFSPHSILAPSPCRRSSHQLLPLVSTTK